MRSLSFMQSVRIRLLAIALLPMLVVLPMLLGATISRWSNKCDRLLITKVNGDLTIAHQYLNRLLEHSSERIQALAASRVFAEKLAGASKDSLKDYLEESRRELALDFLYIVDSEGNILASSLPMRGRAPHADWPIVSDAIAGKASSGIDIFSEEELAAVSHELADRARIDLIPTQGAVPTQRPHETRGMVVHNATPIKAESSEAAALVGGLLLNRNLKFIDTINDLVYREGSLPEGSKGTATLFLEDVRITTNVRLFENVRALGTRVSAAVRAAVLDEGQVWLDRAFVVNDWFISAYEPIFDSRGQRVGMLYVGFLERPFQRDKFASVAIIGISFLLVAVVSVPIFLQWAGRIFKPIEHMASTILRVEGGDLNARIGSIASGDEIGRVARQFDALLDQLQERDRELRDWANELNRRVDEQTSELKEANKRLEAATQQLVMSEKLAAIGEITAGVAHEINNPIAVIQGNLDVIRESLGTNTLGFDAEMALIDEQVYRINLIVNKLLQFARPEEFAVDAERQSPNEVVTDCLVLVQHLLNKINITIVRNEGAEGLVLIPRTELQQVLINLIVNAIHAMPDGGKLTLETYDFEQEGTPGVVIKVSDTGKGMTPEVLKRVFDPFFTTKRREGTGLGLSISQTLIKRCGGHISVVSTEGAGTTFSIWMPRAE